MPFPKVDPKQSFPKLEEEILDFWQQEKIFEESVERDAPRGDFVFYDGPPFATGLPHYGHILQGVIKDVVPRWRTMQGYHVPRVWGWDCHGLPVENLIEKKLGLDKPGAIEEYGVGKFNEECRASVLEYADEWKKSIARMGRWIDMENDYKTMDVEFMDSVWWVFKSLWDKELIYEGLKPMHVCPRCVTPLSNFEVGLGYKDTTDLTAIAKFELEDEPGTFLLAWTTTPWTLPGNVALAVGGEISYAKVQTSNGIFVLARELVEKVFGESEHKIVGEMKGSELAGKKYKPLFSYFKPEEDQLVGIKKLPSSQVDSNLEEINEEDKSIELKITEEGENYKNSLKFFEEAEKWKNAFRVFKGDFVSTEDGTGIVHIAPAFGDDDFALAKTENLPVIQHVSMNGKFTSEVTDFAGLEVKPADDPRKTDQKIIDWLDANDKLFSSDKVRHSYPHCWRCDTPLLNYATSSWFVAVEKIKQQLLDNNQKINWVPEHVRDGRFGKWLEGARDWAISRNRFWGAPLPVWRCEKCGETKCIGGRSELEKLSGKKVDDLHKHFVDEIKLDCECGGKMKRIPEVLDCWFESGSMPYAQFATKADTQLPADFIAEAQDQTRGWFYTLHVLGTALFEKPAFKNCICSGLVLAEDGHKMSKSKKNFPDPQEIFDKFGADAMRLYLVGSPVVNAEALRFSERGVEETLRNVLLPIWNTHYFFTTYANADGWEGGEIPAEPSNKLDRWILSELNILIRDLTAALENYRLQDAVRPLAEFADGLTNWYVRRSRRRFWKSENDGDKNEAYATLFEVLTTVTKLLAPFAPFFAEKVFRDLTGKKSVHLADWPTADESRIDKKVHIETSFVRNIIRLGLKNRANQKIANRQPLQSLTIGLPEGQEFLDEAIENNSLIIKEELNVKEILRENPLKIAKMIVDVNARVAGPRFGKRMQEIIGLAKADHVENPPEIDGVKIGGEILSGDEIKIRFEPREDLGNNFSVEADLDGIVVALDTNLTPELVLEGRARDLNRAIQDLRKEADLEVSDRIELQLVGADEILADENLKNWLTEETLAEKIVTEISKPLAEKEIDGIKIGLRKI